MTRTLQELAARLVADHHLIPAASLSLVSPSDLPQFEFLGVREYWGSVMSVALVAGDALQVPDIQQSTERFYSFTRSLLPYAGKLVVGLGSIRLGSFGLVGFVFSGGCPPERLEAIRRSKHGSAWRKDYAVAWALDLPAGLVHAHRGLPLRVFPGRAYFKRVLSTVAA
jgi:hypothetical protein